MHANMKCHLSLSKKLYFASKEQTFCDQILKSKAKSGYAAKTKHRDFSATDLLESISEN